MQLFLVTILGFILISSNPAVTCDAFSLIAAAAVTSSRETTTIDIRGTQCTTTVSSLLSAHTQISESIATTGIEEEETNNNVPVHRSVVLSRRNVMMVTTTSGAIALIALLQGTTNANADVSDGNTLPEGAQQFARTIKLKTDLKDVTKRLLTVSDENPIDKKEWDNIGKFLRTVYSTADNDMKNIAKGLAYNPPNQKQAMKDVDEIKKYAQAGDISVSKQDTTRLASILTKIRELLDDFLASLSDVPDEI